MRYLLIILLSFMFSAFCQGQDNAPDFMVKTTNGDSIRLYSDALDVGKTVVLELFWEGCPPCNTFAPFMTDLYKEWGNGTEDVVFIALDVLENETDEDVDKFQTRHGHEWPGVSAEGGSLEAVAPYKENMFGRYLGTPAIVVIAPNRTVNFSPNGSNITAVGMNLIGVAIAATGASKGVTFNSEPQAIEDIICKQALPQREDIWATSAACGNQPVVSSVDPYEEDLCNEYTITYRWKTNSGCGEVRERTVSFNVIPDTEPPTFDQSPPESFPTIRNGDPFPVQDTLTATDNCSSATVVAIVDTIDYNCCESYSVFYRWVATDDCGNSAEERVGFVVRPSLDLPVFDTIPTPIKDSLYIDSLPAQQVLTATDNCGAVTVTPFIDDYVADYCNGYTVTYRWTAENVCGRMSETSLSFNVLPDTEGPVFDQNPSSVLNINCNQAFPQQDTLTAVDAVSGPAMVIQSVDEFGDLCSGTKTITYRWTAVDTCGNTSEKSISFNVADSLENTSPTLIGGIQTIDERNIGAVSLVFSGGIDTTIMTNPDGLFRMPELEVTGPFTVRPEKNTDILNGLTTFDLVLITKHVLGSEPFQDAIQQVAADANLSNSVSTFDIVLLRKVILNIEDELPAGSWRFFPESVNLNSLEQLREIMFTGVKIGDVNFSATLSEFTGAQPRNHERAIALQVPDRSVEAGEIISIPFSLDDYTALLGYQFTLDFDPSVLQFQTMTNPAIANFNSINSNDLLKERGQLAFSWHDVKSPVTEELFTVQFKAIKPGDLRELMQLSSAITGAEAYIANTEEIVNIELKFVPLDHTTRREIQLLPNPTSSDATMLSIHLAEKEQVAIQLLTIDGQQLQTLEYVSSEEGKQLITLPINDLNAGVYIVHLIYADGKSTYSKLIKH